MERAEEAFSLDVELLADRIRRARESAATDGKVLSVNELAKRCRFYNGTHVSRLENAQQSLPSLNTVATIAGALGASLDDLSGLREWAEARRAPTAPGDDQYPGGVDLSGWPKEAVAEAQRSAHAARHKLSMRGWIRLLDHWAGAIAGARQIVESDRPENGRTRPAAPRIRR